MNHPTQQSGPMVHFSIRRNFLLALGLTCLLLVVLLLLCIVQQETLGKTLILAMIMVPVLALFAESWRRQISITDEAIISRRLFRQKIVPFNKITAVDTTRVKQRVFISISTEEDFIIFSNNYDHFDQLLARLQKQLPESVISAETRELANDLPNKNNNLFSVWLAVVALLLVIYVQLGGTF